MTKNFFHSPQKFLQYKYSSLRLCYRKSTSNVNVSFHRFENRGRHTIHMHLLVWLENLGTINLDRIRASIPDDYSRLAYLVRAKYYFLRLNEQLLQNWLLILSSIFKFYFFTISVISSCHCCITLYSQKNKINFHFYRSLYSCHI